MYLDAEATSLSLKALAQINPGSDLLPKVARWLVKNRRNGYYWLFDQRDGIRDLRTD